MNITYSIDKVSRIVSVSYTGNPDFDEWANMMCDVFRDPNFEPGFSFILDRRLAKAPPARAYIEQIAAFVQSHQIELGKSRVAVVVSEITSFGMARMAQGLMNETENLQVFKDIEKAKAVAMSSSVRINIRNKTVIPDGTLENWKKNINSNV